MNLRAVPAGLTETIPAWVALTGDVRWPVVVRRGSPRSYRLFLGDQQVVLESPTGSWGAAEAQFLREKERWLQRQFVRQAQGRHALAELRRTSLSQARLFGRPVPITFATGSKLWYRYDGQQLTVVLNARWARRLEAQPNDRQRVVTAVLRRLATDYLTRRTRQLAELVGVTVHDIRVKGHRSKWGSCSYEGNINLNWYLILLDRAVADYVIVHELMHRLEMNHSDRFWAQVERWLPDYPALIKRLRADEWVLGAYESRPAA